MVPMFNILIRDGIEVLLSVKVPSDDILESTYKKRTRESDQHENSIGNIRTRNYSTSLAVKLSGVEDHGEEMLGSKDQSPKF